MFRDRRTFAPDGTGSAPAEAAPAPASAAPAPSGPAPAATPAADPAPAAAAAAPAAAPPAGGRPDWLPENFWDGEKGQPNVEALAKSWKDTRASLSKRKEDLLKEIGGEKPAAPEAYEFKEPQVPAFVKAGLKDLDAKHPLVQQTMEFAKANGLSQQGFEQALTMAFNLAFAHIPNPAAETKKLGERAPDRINRVSAWAKANLSDKAVATLQRFARSADAIEAIEELMVVAGEPAFAPQSSGFDSALTQSKLDELMKDERYWHPTKRDPAFVTQVTEGFRKLYPGRA